MNKDYTEVILSETSENIDYDALFDRLELTLNDKDKKALQNVREVFAYYTQTYCVVDEENKYETRVRDYDYKKPANFEKCLYYGRKHLYD